MFILIYKAEWMNVCINGLVYVLLKYSTGIGVLHNVDNKEKEYITIMECFFKVVLAKANNGCH